MFQRVKVLGIGASLFAVIGIGGLGAHGVFAQSTATPPATSSVSTTTAPSAYSVFVKKLATNLGVADSTKVDAAIKTTLKQMIDEQLAAGNISANEATTMKAEIDKATDASSLAVLDDIVGGDHGKADKETNDANGQSGNAQNADGETNDGNGTAAANGTPTK